MQYINEKPSTTTLCASRLYHHAVSMLIGRAACSVSALRAASAWLADDAEALDRGDPNRDALYELAGILIENVEDE